MPSGKIDIGTCPLTLPELWCCKLEVNEGAMSEAISRKGYESSEKGAEALGMCEQIDDEATLSRYFPTYRSVKTHDLGPLLYLTSLCVIRSSR